MGRIWRFSLPILECLTFYLLVYGYYARSGGLAYINQLDPLSIKGFLAGELKHRGRANGNTAFLGQVNGGIA
jgi:hypothetical protein